MQINENFFLLLLVIIGASGILEKQARSIVTYASIAAGILGFCGPIIGTKVLKFCCKSERNCNFLSILECRRKIHQGISDNTHGYYLDPLFDEVDHW
jgi:hypothetical protein